MRLSGDLSPGSRERPRVNRLAGEKSPYLLQHAKNPVDWYPWGGEAFSRATQENKPVFLSIGYAACHWCHVMAHESFEDDEVAALLNRDFVCIKVDREERPDIDGVYMDVCQIMTGRGGWPLTIIMTPEKKPFFAATYLPKSGRFGMTGLLELLPQVAGLWRDRRDELENSADTILLTLRQPAPASTETGIGDSLPEEGYGELAARFDDLYGGFGSAPKFPSLHNVLFLLRFFGQCGKKHALTMATRTLAAVTMGGIYDHVGGGVHRYATDRRWRVPHFEKMLYDQALLLMACTEAYEATRQDDFRRVAANVVAYVKRDLTSPEGMFFSAEDADSEGGEGSFYLWTTDELEEVLGHDDAGIAKTVFNAVPEGNTGESGAGRKNILYRTRTLHELATLLKMPEPDLGLRVQAIRTALFQAREKRPRPLCDDKILTDWNSLFIGALARAAFVFDNQEYLIVAERALQVLLGRMRTPEGGLFHRFRDGDAAIPAFGSDYAFTVHALIQLYGAGFNPRYLGTALELQEYFGQHFSDENGGFFSVSDDAEQLPIRKKEIDDGAVPSCNSVAIGNLLALARLTGDERFGEAADAAARAFAGVVRQSPASHGYFLCALGQALWPPAEIVITGKSEDSGSRAMIETIRSRYRPGLLVIRIPDTEEEEEMIHRIAPYTREMTGTGGVPTAYVCSGRTCAAPVTDAAGLSSLLARDGRKKE